MLLGNLFAYCAEENGKQKFKDTYGKYVIAEFAIKDKNITINDNVMLNGVEILEETENRIKLKFKHEETTIVKVMEQISNYCKIEDIHMKEAELEDILKEIYKGAHKC